MSSTYQSHLLLAPSPPRPGFSSGVPIYSLRIPHYTCCNECSIGNVYLHWLFLLYNRIGQFNFSFLR